MSNRDDMTPEDWVAFSVTCAVVLSVWAVLVFVVASALNSLA